MENTGFGGRQDRSPTSNTLINEKVDWDGAPIAAEAQVFIQHENLDPATSDRDVIDTGERSVSGESGHGGSSESEDFANCRRLAVVVGNAQTDVETHVYTLLESIYAYKCAHISNAEALIAFCKRNGIKCTKATQNSPFLPLLKAVHPDADTQVNSLRARALLHAADQKVCAGGVANFLVRNGGIKACAGRMVRQGKGHAASPDTVVVRKPKGGKVSCQLPALPDGYYNVRVRFLDGQPECIGTLYEQT